MGKSSENQRCDLHDTDISPRLSDPARSAERIQERGAEPGRRFPAASAGTLRVRGLPPSPRAPSEPLCRACPLNHGGRTRAPPLPPPPHHRRPCGRDRGSRRRPTAQAAPALEEGAAPATAPKSPGSRSDPTARRAPALCSRHRSTHQPAARHSSPRDAEREQARARARPLRRGPAPAPEALARGRREASGGSWGCAGEAGTSQRAGSF